MLDQHLAELYNVPTKVLVQAIKRNDKRFPGDFMFQLKQREFKNLRSQIVTSSCLPVGRQGAVVGICHLFLLNKVLPCSRVS